MLTAAQKGQTECVEELLKHEADVESRDNQGDSALTLAVGFGNVETIKVLLNHKADIEGRGLHERTPL